MKTRIQNNQLIDIQAASNLINQGKVLVISGEEALLTQLPRGKWIGGTIPYFYLSPGKGRMDKSKVFVSDFSDWISNSKIETLDVKSLSTVCKNGYNNGFNFLILPAAQDIHFSFALNAPDFENLYTNPLIGLVAGVDLDELAKGRLSKTFNGLTGECLTDKGVVLHCELPINRVARIEIINVFDPTNEVHIEVTKDSSTVGDCIINGKPANLYDYVKQNNVDISYPLVCDYAGATVNVSFQQLNDEKKEIVFYAPLFKGKKYTTANKFDSYSRIFGEKMKDVLKRETHIIYNCNCILNYLYGELDKNDIGFSGVATFGEIAFNMLNQTFTYLDIDEE